ncbi:glycoside hydrolase family 88 protein [candidate division KSB1 bacterium]|nr:glycoside hydrolase family 88 protein [candidate division KSB1 bacterium]
MKILILSVLFITFATTAFTADKTPPASSSLTEVVAIMKKVADWQLAHPRHEDTEWHNGAMYAGIMELYKSTKDSKYLDVLLEMGERNEWRPGKRLRHADDHCIGQTYIELYLIEKDSRKIIAIQNTFDEIMDAPKDGRKDWWWCDALFMAPPALARLATATGEQKYLDFMNTMWWDTTDYLYDSKEHLYFRDERFFSMLEKNGRKVFWSRGNGWVLAGLCRVLQYMPDDYTHRERYVSLFKQMSAKVASLQQDDGFWRASLLNPDLYPAGESSGTGFFTYALTWGINQDLLSKKKYLPVVQNGWSALVSAVDNSGKLCWVQQVGDQPTQLRREDTETYGTGAFLLAGCEMIRFLKIEQPTESDK